MRLLRNLSLARKLALSSLCALMLLGALTSLALATMERLAESQRSQAAAFDAQRQLGVMQRAIAEISGAARSILVQPTVDGIGLEAMRGDLAGSDARAALAALRDAGGGDGGDVAALDRDLGQLRRLVAQLTQQKQALAALRDGPFASLREQFDRELQPVLGDLAAQDMPPSDLQNLRASLLLLQGAVADMQGGTLRFLAAATPESRFLALSAGFVSEAHFHSITAAPAAPPLKEALQKLVLGADELRSSTVQFFDLTTSLAAAAEDLERTRKVIEVRVASLADRTEARAAAALSDAARAQRLARRSFGLVATILGGVLAISGLGIARAVAQPFRLLTQAVQRIAAGDTSFPVPFQQQQDEVGRMATAVETLRGVAASAFVQAQLVQRTPNPALTLSPGEDAHVTFVNPAARELLVGAQVGTALRDLLPVPPELATALVDPARLPVRTRVHFRDEVLDLVATGLRDATGTCAGILVVLNRKTREVALAERFEGEVGTVVAGLSHAAEEMRHTAEAMDRTAAGTGDLAAAMASASQQASGNVAQVAATAEELAHSIAEIARQVAEGARIAGEASDEATAMNARVGELSDAASRIGSVVRLISDIAARTNLLALNATIEAARAGDAGRGFAVVAGEVKTLASQTARATQDIAGQIAAMQGRTSEAVGALRGITETISRLNGIASAIAGAVEEQGAATEEIARAVQQAAIGTRSVTAALANVTDAVDQTRAQAAAVLSSAADLTGRSCNLRAETAGFLAAVHAA